MEHPGSRSVCSDQASANSSSKYLTISTSTTSSATPLCRVAHNLHPDFNMIRPHITIKSMQRLASEGTLLVLPVQQGAKHVEQIRALAPEHMCVEQSASNTSPPQHEPVQTQLAGHNGPERGDATSSFPIGMHIQFISVTFCGRQ
jgi:hypothetical protein